VSHSLLNGNVNQYGDFDQCLNIEHSLGDSGEIIKGQYVLAFFDLQVNAKVNDPQLKHMLALAHSYDVIRSNFSDVSDTVGIKSQAYLLITNTHNILFPSICAFSYSIYLL